MASKQIQCEMCCNEHAVGYCKTCGYFGETCVNIHKTGKMFQTHTVIMLEAVKKHTDSLEIPNVKLRDITEERCKQHPTEKAIFLCNIHDSMICGRCLHSGHRPCGDEVVDLLHEVVNIDCEKVNTMKSLLMEVKHEILLLKNEAEHRKENYNKNADKCVQDCMELGNKIKQRVDELTEGIKDGITEKHNENLTTHSHITKMCDEKTKWCQDEESKIEDFVDNNMAGHLYLMSRHFEKEVSDARSHLKEIRYKHTFKGFDFKENNVILKCVFEDLEEVCEQQEEVTGSDDGNANDVCASTTKINKTRRELTALLRQVKQDLDQSEKTMHALFDEMKQVKHDKDNSEKKRKILKEELLKAKQGIEESEKTSQDLCYELKIVKQDLDNSEKTRRELTALLNQTKQDLDQSEKARIALCDELKQVKQDKDNSEKKWKIFKQELQKAKQDIEESEKTRKALCDELQKLKQDIDNSEKKRRSLEQELSKAKHDMEEAKKTGKQFEQEQLKAKQDIEESEKSRQSLLDKLKQVNQDLDKSEKRNTLEKEFLQAKQVIEQPEKKMQKLHEELKEVKQVRGIASPGVSLTIGPASRPDARLPVPSYESSASVEDIIIESEQHGAICVEVDDSLVYTVKSFSCEWPSFVHHCTQVKEIWVQYHDVLPTFDHGLIPDNLQTEKAFLSNLNSVSVYFAFVGLLPAEISLIADRVSTLGDRKLAKCFDSAERKFKSFESICSQSQIAPLVIISHVDAQKQAFRLGERYRKSIQPERECVFVVICENKQCNHDRTNLTQLFAYTCDSEVTAIQKEIPKLLKRWTYRMLAERINTLKILSQRSYQEGVEKEEGAWQQSDDRKSSLPKLKELFAESRALYSRNRLPAEDFPEFPQESKRPDKKMLKKISKTENVLGCGDRFGTILVLIDEEVENRETTEESLISKLKRFGFGNVDLDFKYVSKGLQYFIKSGDTIFCNNDQSFGTLAGFALQDEDDTNDKKKVLALFSRHLAIHCANSELKVEEKIIGDILNTNDEGADIAAAVVYPDLANDCYNKFVTEEGTEKTCVTFDQYTEEVSFAGTLVHLVGAASEEIGLGKIVVTNFYSKQAQSMNTFLLENRASNEHVFCEPGDSGAMILTYFPDEDKLVALGMLIGSTDKKNDDKTEEIANPFASSKKKYRATYAKDISGPIYAAFFLKDGLDELSNLHGGRFCLFSENNNTS